MKKLILPSLALIALGITACTPRADGGEAGGAAKVAFASSAGPIITKNCVSCHSGDRPKEGLDLSSLENLNKGARGNPVIVAGKSADSTLYKAITGNGAKLMPPDAKMSDADIEQIKKWIDAGATE
ncbi:MAG: c-type cytochrome domain-containing protein [Fimbriimonadaceae bacterium]